MFKKQLTALLATAAFAMPIAAYASGDHAHGDADVARAYIKEIQADDNAYIAAHNSAFFKKLAEGQHPRATVRSIRHASRM